MDGDENTTLATEPSEPSGPATFPDGQFAQDIERIKNDLVASGFRHFNLSGLSAGFDCFDVVKAVAAHAATKGLKSFLIVPSYTEAIAIKNRGFFNVLTMEVAYHLKKTERFKDLIGSKAVLFVTLDGSRTIASDVVGCFIQKLVNESAKDNYAWNLVVMSSFFTPSPLPFGSLSEPVMNLGLSLERCLELESSQPPVLMETLGQHESWNDRMERLINETFRKNRSGFIICFVPRHLVRRALEFVPSKVNLSAFDLYVDHDSWIDPRGKQQILMLDPYNIHSNFVWNIPNVTDVLTTGIKRGFFFDQRQGRVIEKTVQLSRRELYQQMAICRQSQCNATLHCDFDFLTALQERPWEPAPQTDDSSMFDFLNIKNWPHLPPSAENQSIQAQRATTMKRFKTLGCIEDGDEEGTYILTADLGIMMRENLHCFPELSINAACMIAALQFQDASPHAYRTVLLLAAIMSVGLVSTDIPMIRWHDGEPPEFLYGGPQRTLGDMLCGSATGLFHRGAPWLALGVWETYRVESDDFMTSGLVFRDTGENWQPVADGTFLIDVLRARQVAELVERMRDLFGGDFPELRHDESPPPLEDWEFEIVEQCLIHGWLSNMLVWPENTRRFFDATTEEVADLSCDFGPDLDHIEKALSQGGNTQPRNFILYHHLADQGGVKAAFGFVVGLETLQTVMGRVASDHDGEDEG
ncbi:hypothetical protein CKAH01_04251 [Colletotrichum kahawae]|uniref:Uncharacterized protein n=1 Tax=Colletotrichum kahawae TaxID=34407 RepID=A0AAE0D9X9_COLKA|nr:hypothetical protein CKAH01_04251 [Colletotrichum kahawae]